MKAHNAAGWIHRGLDDYDRLMEASGRRLGRQCHAYFE